MCNVSVVETVPAHRNSTRNVVNLRNCETDLSPIYTTTFNLG